MGDNPSTGDDGAHADRGLPTELEDLQESRQSAQKQLDGAAKALKRCRQMRGADAHKRAWYYEEQVQRARERLERIESRIAELTKGN